MDFEGDDYEFLSMIKHIGAISASRYLGMIYSILRVGDLGLDIPRLLSILDHQVSYGWSVGYRIKIIANAIRAEIEGKSA